jgi:hypothetical protein
MGDRGLTRSSGSKHRKFNVMLFYCCLPPLLWGAISAHVCLERVRRACDVACGALRLSSGQYQTLPAAMLQGFLFTCICFGSMVFGGTCWLGHWSEVGVSFVHLLFYGMAFQRFAAVPRCAQALSPLNWICRMHLASE